VAAAGRGKRRAARGTQDGTSAARPACGNVAAADACRVGAGRRAGIA